MRLRGSAFLLALLAGFLTLSLGPATDRLAAQSATIYDGSYNVYAIGGPNDGEPLSRQAKVTLRTDYLHAGNVLMYRDSTFLGMQTFAARAAIFGVREINCTVNVSSLPDGPARLKLLVFDRTFRRLIGFTSVDVWIARPRIDVPSKLTSSALKAELRGRTGDAEFLLRVSSSDAPLLVPPSMAGGRDDKVSGADTLCYGAWTRPSSGGQVPDRTVVFNIDNVYRIHGLDARLVLWSRREGRKWTHSSVVPLRALIRQWQIGLANQDVVDDTTSSSPSAGSGDSQLDESKL